MESPTTNRILTSSKKGILKSTDTRAVAPGQSNLEKSISKGFVSCQPNLKKSNSKISETNEKWDLAETAEDERILDEEKISQLKEQINTWKYRTMRAEERVTRLLQRNEQRVKNAHDPLRWATLARGELLPREGGRRARLSDSLELLTEPL